MKLRPFAFVAAALAVAPLAGCPIYDSSEIPVDPAYRCNDVDCGPNGYCDAYGYCASTNGSCAGIYCGSGQECRIENGTARCTSSTDGGRPDSGKDGSTDTGPDAKPDSGFSGCRSNSACVGDGAKCLNGSCTAPADQCSDATQCAAGSACVEGVCTPTCSANKACPTGYACDLDKGVCTNNPTVCGPTGATCSGGTTCAAEHCVTPCNADKTCAGDLVCVDGGCIPDQRPQFVCLVEGVRDTCAQGSLCLRHSCYIACDPQVADSCKAADVFNQCKPVTASGKNYNVCGSSTNLGAECDASAGKSCNAGKVCIDGFCR